MKSCPGQSGALAGLLIKFSWHTSTLLDISHYAVEVTYLSQKKLENKKAIINIVNRGNECLKWAIRAALFPEPKGKNPKRPSNYPVDDGIDYTGIDFPTLLSQIKKLEAQNENLEINEFGWGKDCVTVHRISEKRADVPRINLMLIESGKTTILLCKASKRLAI